MRGWHDLEVWLSGRPTRGWDQLVRRFAILYPPDVSIVASSYEDVYGK